MRELSDEEVFGSQPTSAELSDEDVFGPTAAPTRGKRGKEKSIYVPQDTPGDRIGSVLENMQFEPRAGIDFKAESARSLRPAAVTTRLPSEARPSIPVDEGFAQNAARIFRKVVGGIEQGKSGLVRMAGDVTGLDGVSEAAQRWNRSATALMNQTEAGKTTIDGFTPNSPVQALPGAAEGAAVSIGQQLPALLTGNVPAALAMMMGQSTGQQYGEVRDKGLTVAPAIANAVLTGAAEVLGEKFGGTPGTIRALKGAIAGNAPALVAAEMARAGLRDIPGELATTTMQYGVDAAPIMGTNAAPSLRELGGQLKDTALQTVLQGGMMTGGGAALAGAVRGAMRNPPPLQTPPAMERELSDAEVFGEQPGAPVTPADAGPPTQQNQPQALDTQAPAATNSIAPQKAIDTPAPAPDAVAAASQSLAARLTERANAERQRGNTARADALTTMAQEAQQAADNPNLIDEMLAEDAPPATEQKPAPALAQPALAATETIATEGANVQNTPIRPPGSAEAQAQAAPAQAGAPAGSQPQGPAAAGTTAGNAGVQAAGVNAPAAQSQQADAAIENVAPQRLGRNNTPLTEGGKPFKTNREAKLAQKQQPMMRVVKAGKGKAAGYALAPKTEKQIAAQEKAARRLGGGYTSPAGEAISAHSFIADKGGLAPEARADMGMDGNQRIGSRWLFAGAGKGLTIERATEYLVEEGYLQEGASHSQALALIKRSLSQPQYTPEGTERMAQAEAETQFEDHLAAQQEAAAEDPDFDPFPAGDGWLEADLQEAGYDVASPEIQAELRALIDLADAAGIDSESLMLDAHDATHNGTTQEYYEEAKSALEKAIARGDENSSEDAGHPSSAPEQEPAGPAAAAEPGPADDGGLTGYTPKEVTDRLDKLEQAEKVRQAADTKADAEAKKERERKDIASRQDASADNFELGQDADDSLSGQKGMFSRPDKARTPSVWRSALQDSIEGLSTGAAPAQGWQDAIKGLINKGAIKADEVEWSGVTDWLKLQSGKVTKDQVLDYLDGNGVKVEETMLSNDGYMRDARGGRIDDGAGGFVANGKPTKYENYQLPGGKNYRELLLTLPERGAEQYTRANIETLPADDPATSQPDVFWYFKVPGNVLQIPKSKYPSQVDARDYIIREKQPAAPEEQNYKSSHWDQRNILAHVRFNERTDADGKRVLFIEEIQSDWAQEGKKGGFLRSANTTGWQASSSGGGWFVVRDASGEKVGEYRASDARDAIKMAGLNFGSGTVPSAPFVGKTDAWVALAIKRMVSYAAENGFDRVAFVNGQQSADRYDLSKQLDQIMFDRYADGTYRIMGFTKDGRGGAQDFGNHRAEDLPNVVGKDLAEKIVNDPDKSGAFRGLDLKVGGEGMKAFYDKIVPAVAKDVLKKLGGSGMTTVNLALDLRTEGGRNVQVNRFREEMQTKYGDGIMMKMTPEERATLKALEDGRTPQPGFDITPAMREKAAGGLPMFSKNDQTTTNTAESIRVALTKRFGPLVAAMEKRGFLKIWSDTAQFNASGQASEQIQGAAQGMWDGKTAHLFADGIAQGDEVAVMLHEVGEHASMQQMLGPKQYNRLVARAHDLMYADDAVALEAVARIPDNTPEKFRDSELLAYMIEIVASQEAKASPTARKWLADVVAAIRAWWFQTPMAQKLLDYGIRMELTPKDIAALAVRAVNWKGAQSVQDVDIQLSRPAPAASSWTAPPGAPPVNPNTGAVSPQPWNVAEPGTLDNFVRAIQNNKIDLKRVREAIEAQAGPIASQADAYLNEELYHGKVSARVTALHEQQVEPILKKIAVAGQNSGITLDDVNQYLHARHAPERNAAMQAINPGMPNNAALSGMSDADAAQILADFTAAGKTAGLANIAADVDQLLSDTRTGLVADGLEDAGTVQAWEQAYQHYAPLQRDIKSSGTPKGQGISIRGPEARRAVGSNKEVVNILANIVAQAETAAIRAEKAIVGRALLDMARQHPNPAFWKVDAAPTKPRIDKDTGLVIRNAIDPMFQTADNVVMVKDYGIEHFIVFEKNSERAMAVAKAMKNLDIAPMNRILEVASKGTRFIASLLTQRNPLFWMTNFSRDIQGAMINLQGTDAEGLQDKVLANLPKAFKGMHALVRGTGAGQWARYAREIKDAGGTTGYMQQFENSDARMDDLKKIVAQMQQGKADPRRLARVALEFVDDYNDIIENAVRLSVFQAARDNGVSTDKAASIAKNITVNFNRKGNLSPPINALYMFFNASVQGTARLAQALATSRSAQVVIGGIAVMGFLLDTMNRAMSDDDEETGRNRYDMIPEFEKSKNWIFMNPMRPGEYVKVPLPLGPHVFHNAGRLLSDATFRNDKRNAAEYGWSMASTVLDAFSPLGDTPSVSQLIAPSILDPVVQLAENKSFTGGPVYRSDDMGFGKTDPKPAYTRHFESTPDLWKAASRGLNDLTGGDKDKPGKLNVEPDILKHVFYAMTGGPGRMVDQTTDAAQAQARGDSPSVNRVPFVSRFYGKNDDRQRERVYYDDRKHAMDTKTRFDHFMKIGRPDLAREVAEELGDGDLAKGRRLMREHAGAQSSVRKLNKQIRAELQKQDSGEDRAEQLRALKQRRVKVMGGAVRDPDDE